MTNTSVPPFLLTMRASWRGWLDSDGPAPSLGWQIAWSAVWAAGFALLFTIIGFIATAHSVADWLNLHNWGLWLCRNFVIAAIISYTTQALFKLIFALFGTAWTRDLTGWKRAAVFSALPLLGTAIGWPIGMAVVFGRVTLLSVLNAGTLISLAVISLLMSALFRLYFSMRYRETKARLRANEAQLRLLQGQMEPHFLFNTLANVISLVDADAPRAKHMLEALTDYLRASLVGMRHDDSTLAAELELARRYLELMRTRMDERLRFEIEADDTLRQARLMPLALQPLIENAVKHGLEPQVDGGTVRVHATRAVVDGRDSLQICVDDDGVGLEAASQRPRRQVAGGPDGHGIALANLRERLQARFGASARLALTELASGGTRACLVIPWAVADATR